jgi:hypothetical protein
VTGGWDELVAAALIGTDRRPVGPAVPPGAPDALGAALAGRGAEERLLASAAAWTVARRAGARAGARVDVTPAEADSRPMCSAAAGARLRALLEEQDRLLVTQWLELAAERGLRPPPELVPDLLDHEHSRLVGELAGPLGLWLAEREPRWAFVRGGADDIEAVWAGGGREERRALLERLRRTDPAAGRELLASTFAEETWEDREAFLDLMAIGLSGDDEPFLEAALDDPRKRVRLEAAGRLAALPRSRYAARMAERTAPLLRVEDGQLVAELPGPPDAAMERDGVDASGRRADRLSSMLAATPLATWSPDLVALPVADDLGPAVHAGWARAAKAQRDAAWARTLWRHDYELLDVLPRAEGEALAATAEDPFSAALELSGSWGPELSRAVLATVPERSRHVGVAGYQLDPSLAPEAEPLRDLGRRDINQLCDVLATRAAMLRELS